MPSYWLLKTEPDCYNFTNLEHDGTTVWDGVTNNAALKHIRAMRPGDYAFIYHTGTERQIIGVVEITSEPYPDPQADKPNLVVVDVRLIRRLPRYVPLAEIKQDPLFADCALIRQGRLSVVPVTPEQWVKLSHMAAFNP